MENQEMEIDIKEIFSLLLSKMKFIILLTVIGLLAAFLYAKVFLPVKYTSQVSIYVKSSASASQIVGDATTVDLSAAKSLAETYIVILNEDIVYDQVSEMLLRDYEASDLSRFFSISVEDGKQMISANQIRNLVTITSVNETEVINISANTTSANISADICTYISQVAPELLTRVTRAGSVETIGEAKVPKEPSSPNVKKTTAIGGLLGMVIAVAIVVIMSLLDNCISSAEDIRVRFEIPVLAEIPDIETETKGGGYYK